MPRRDTLLQIWIQGNPYVLVNCYAPNTETGQIKTFQDLANRLNDLDADPECNYIFGGDWNLIFDTTMDSMGGIYLKSIFHLRSIMSDYEWLIFIDCEILA